ARTPGSARAARARLPASRPPRRFPGEVGDGAEVVEMAMCDEDPRTGGAEPRELEAEVRRVSAGIDHGALRRAALAPDGVAVRLERTELVSVDGQRHRGESSGSWLAIRRVREEVCPWCATGASPRSRRR